jgi:hypothetical protein
MTKTILIKIVDKSEQRPFALWDDYRTLGDTIYLKITDMGNDNYTKALMFHGLWEKLRNDDLGISDDSVDAFDIANPELDEPGDSLEAPYHRPHVEAGLFERLVIQITGEDYTVYDEAYKED